MHRRMVKPIRSGSSIILELKSRLRKFLMQRGLVVLRF